MNSKIDSSCFEPERPEPRNRAIEIISSTRMEYDWLKNHLNPDESINLICTVGGRDYDVVLIDSPKIDVVQIQATTEGGLVCVVSPVEQVCFTTIISKKVNDDPPREIGFHTTMKRTEKE